MNSLKIKRAYVTSEPTDGFRILVDRLWPRGISKFEADIDLWLMEIAPSSELRKWFKHDPTKWYEFKAHYENELKPKEECINIIKNKLQHSNVTLIYGAKDEYYNQAIVIRDLIHS